MSRLALPTVIALALALSACATSNPDVIGRHETQRMSQVQDATVLSTRPVVVDGTQSGTGAVAGGVIGAISGGSVGGRREGQVAGVLGAVAGAVIGNAIERSSTREAAVEILLQMRNGERRAVVQAQGAEQFAPGEAVILVTSGGKTRVMRAPPVTAPPPSPAVSR